MDINEERRQWIEFIAIKEGYPITKSMSEKDRKILHYLWTHELLYKERNTYKIAKLGYAFLESKLPYNEWAIALNNSQNSSITVNGNIQESFLLNNPNMKAQAITVQTDTKNIPLQENTGSVKSIFKSTWKIIVAIITALIIGYLSKYLGIS